MMTPTAYSFFSIALLFTAIVLGEVYALYVERIRQSLREALTVVEAHCMLVWDFNEAVIALASQQGREIEPGPSSAKSFRKWVESIDRPPE
jgi:hypothetical protein